MLRKFKPEVEVDSAGTDPAIPISEAAKEYLARENALKYLKQAPESLDGKKLGEYGLIVVMEREHEKAVVSKCPEYADKIVVWNIDDPYFLPHGFAEKVFEEIRRRVMELVNSM